MKDFSQIVEEWAMAYKPMQHEPGEASRNQRFFLIEDIVAIPEFMSKIPETKSPCVMYEYMVQATIDGGRVVPSYSVYFPVNCGTSKPNPRAAHRAIRESLDHAFKFIAWIRREQDKDREDLKNIDLDRVRMDTYGPLLNGWYAVFIQFEDVDTFNLCVQDDDYIETEYLYE